MGEGQKFQGDARRRRVQRLKRMIILSALVWMILPVGLSIVLFGRVKALSKQLVETQGYLRQMEETVALQAQKAEEEQQTQQIDRKEIIVAAPVAGADGQDGAVASVEPVAAHKVYLTFDDGPSKYTEEILDILDAYDVKATFLCLARRMSILWRCSGRLPHGGTP